VAFLPQRVVLADGDHGLLVDLDQALCVETLHQLVAGRPGFTLTECFPDLGQAVVTGAEGRYAHELVVPFEAPGPPRPALPCLPRAGEPARPRTFPPGSEWLDLKLYAGPASLDQLLREHLGPLLAGSGGEGMGDRWFFVRYWEPSPHLRLRLHGDPARLLGCLLPRLTQLLAQPLAVGLLWKIQLDTYEQEVERYGGQVGMALSPGRGLVLPGQPGGAQGARGRAGAGKPLARGPAAGGPHLGQPGAGVARTPRPGGNHPGRLPQGVR
jgi:hypothetical protein